MGIFLSLGSNVGERESYLKQAMESLAREGVPVLVESSVYETEPVEAPPQNSFLNAAVGVETQLSPEELLTTCLKVETRLGRVREGFRTPRTIDIDLLLYGNEVRKDPALTLPHPRMQARRFVLVPLAEIAPTARHPVLGATVAEMLASCPDSSRVLLWQPTT